MIKKILISLSLIFASLGACGQNFLPPEEAFKVVAEYAAADQALVYFSPEVVAHKKLPALSIDEVSKGFGGDVLVCQTTEQVLSFIHNIDWHNKVLLMMSSGNFDGIDYDALGAAIVAKL